MANRRLPKGQWFRLDPSEVLEPDPAEVDPDEVELNAEVLAAAGHQDPKYQRALQHRLNLERSLRRKPLPVAGAPTSSRPAPSTPARSTSGSSPRSSTTV